MTDIAALSTRNAARRQHMHIRADRLACFKAAGKRLCASGAKARYQA